MSEELGVVISTVGKWIKRGQVESKVQKPTKKILVKKGSVTLKKHADR